MDSRIEMPDVRQREIFGKLILFLKKYPNNRDTNAEQYHHLLHWMEHKGYCDGSAGIWLFVNWANENARNGKNKHDLAWFKKTRQEIVSWDGSNDLSVEQQNEFDAYLSFAEYIQNIRRYSSEAHGDFHKILFDQPAGPELNYALGGMFTLAELEDRFEKMFQAGMFENQMTLLSSHHHDTALFSIKGKYYYFDANSPTGAVEIANGTELARCYFNMNRLEKEASCPVGMRIIGFTPPKKIIKQTDLIKDTRIITNKIPNLTYGSGVYEKTALDMAVWVGDEASVDFYLQSGADVNFSTAQNSTPFRKAIYQNRKQIIERLLDTDKVNLKPEYFYLAAQHRATEILAMLLKYEGKKEVNYSVLLETAITNGDEETIQLLLAYGADPFSKAVAKKPLIQLAVELGYVNALELLLISSSKKMSPAELTRRLNQFDLLELAVRKGHPLSTQLLLRYGADANRRIAWQEKSLLQFALEQGDATTANVLLNEEKININQLDKNGKTVLNAAYEGYTVLKERLEYQEQALMQLEFTIKKEDLISQQKEKKCVIKCLKEECHELEKLIQRLDRHEQFDVVPAFYFAIKNGLVKQMEQLLENHDELRLDKGALIVATSAGSVGIIERLYTLGFDLNGYVSKKTPLLVAVDMQNIEAVEKLLKLGADPNFINQDTLFTPLYMAVRNVDMVRLLLNYGANPNKGTLSGTTPLAAAIKIGQLDVAEVLIADGKADINAVDNSNLAPLHIAVQSRSLSSVNFLLKHHANIHMRNGDKKSALQLAAENGWDDITRCLIVHLAQLNQSTIWHIIAENNLITLLKPAQYEYGYFINETDRGNGETALHVAVRQKNIKMIELLLANGALPDRMANNDKTPIDLAFESEDTELAFILLRGSLNPIRMLCEKILKEGKQCTLSNSLLSRFITDSNNNECLSNKAELKIDFAELQALAIKAKKFEIAAVLIKHEMAVFDYPAPTILHLCVARDYPVQLFDLLLHESPELLMQSNQNGLTPLQQAVKCKKFEKAAYLISYYGLELENDIPQDNEIKLLYFACATGDKVLLSLLLDMGININIVSKSGLSPLAAACKNGHDEIVDMLLDNKRGNGPALVYGEAEDRSHYSHLKQLARDKPYLLDRIRIRGYLEKRTGRGKYTGYGWVLGRTETQKTGAAREVEMMIKSRSCNETLFKTRSADLTKGKLGKKIDKLLCVKRS